MPTTTIQVDLDVKEQLRALGRMGESYNDVIKRLLVATRHLPAVRAEGRGPPDSGRTPTWIPLRDKQ
jgi:predicted CopG family antitoxin